MSSASFVVLCVLAGRILATPPLSRPSNDKGVVSLSLKSSSGYANVFSNDQQNTWFNQFQQKMFASMIAGGIEYVFMANGSHLLVPLSENADWEREYKTVSIALFKLLTNLKSMEQSANLLSKILEEAVWFNANGTQSLRSTLKTFLHSYIEIIDKKFGADAELAAEYKKQKSAAKQVVEQDPTMQEAIFEVNDDFMTKFTQNGLKYEKVSVFLQSRNTSCEGLANQFFMEYLSDKMEISNSTVRKQKLMAKALVKKAQSSGYESKVNQIYHNALVQVRPYVVADYTNIPYIRGVISNFIEKELASDPTLQNEITVLMEQMG